MGCEPRLVFSTTPHPECPRCGRPRAGCSCPPAPVAPRGDGVVRVGRSTKGRKGKGVTVLSGIPLAGPELAALARELRRLCGSGGTVRGDAIEIQGDHRDRLVPVLAARGWTVRRSGG